MRVRPLDPGRDLPAVATLLTLGGVERLEAWELEEELARLAPPKVLLRWVGGEGAAVNGTAWLVRYPSLHRVLHVGVVVEPAARRRGLGAALWRAVEAAAAGEEGVEELQAQVREDAADGRLVADRAGFVTIAHAVTATLDLDRWEPDSHVTDVAGIRFLSFADTGEGEDELRRLYAVNRIAALDDPAPGDSFPEYESWLRIVVESPSFRPEGQLLALDGAEWVGLSTVTVAGEEASTGITGVVRSQRGRGVGLALKARACAHAKRSGARTVETEMDSANAAMRAVNRRLGFVERPGYLTLARSV